eukprot:Pgem_evm1s11744
MFAYYLYLFICCCVLILGRVASYQVLHGLGEETGYGLNFRLSDFAHDKNSAFYNYDIPFPIMIGSEHTMGENMVAEGRAWEFRLLF